VDIILKKRIVFVLLIGSIVISSLSLYSNHFTFITFAQLTTTDRFLIWIVTLSLLAYYIKLDTHPQLVPASISSEKKKSEDSSNDNNKSDTSFNDVAGLDEIKEELQEP